MEYTKEQRLFLDHVLKRMGSVYHQVSLKTYFDLDQEKLIFPLWNLSGQWKGIQIYNWKGSKDKNNAEDGKYHTIAKSGPVLYGLEWINENVPVTFISEGIFDALSLLPFGNSVAILGNDPRPLKEQISLLPGFKVAVTDGDKAGSKLSKYADARIVCPDGKDPNDLSYQEVKHLLGEYAQERDLYEDTFRLWRRKRGLNF